MKEDATCDSDFFYIFLLCVLAPLLGECISDYSFSPDFLIAFSGLKFLLFCSLILVLAECILFDLLYIGFNTFRFLLQFNNNTGHLDTCIGISRTTHL